VKYLVPLIALQAQAGWKDVWGSVFSLVAVGGVFAYKKVKK